MLTVLHLSPHPDDEVLGAGATLLGLRDAGHRVINLACSLGRPEQQERRMVLFEILVALFERAYILVYEDDMDKDETRLWASWEDYMREWCRRPDFREALPALLRGEDPDFAAYIQRLASEEAVIKV